MANSKYDMSHIDAMDGHEFERFIASLLRRLGYQNVEVTRGSGDQGVDVLAEKDGVRYAIQCKCYSSDLGNTPVQEVNTGKAIYHCHVGIVVTNRYFTQSAQEAAKATGVLLWDRSKLEKLIAQVQTGPDTELAPPQNEDSLTLWTGSPLLRRGGIALEDKEWKKATQFFERVLNTDPENAEAYLGLVMAEEELSDEVEFWLFYVKHGGHLGSKNMEHAIEFASPALKAWFSKLKEDNERIQAELKERTQKELEDAKVRLLPIREAIKKTAPLISAGYNHIAGLKSDGTVVAVGRNTDGQCEVSGWEDIAATAVNWYHTVGLKSDGTVVAVGNNEKGQCEISSWEDIVAIAAGVEHTAGLKSDGTVVAVGRNTDGQCEVSAWKDIVAIATGATFTIGLKSDGTVVAADNKHIYCREVGGWRNIVAIAANWFHTVGLKLDGTVVTAGISEYDQCEVSGWKDIVAIASGYDHTIGLKSDGTVIVAGNTPGGQCAVQTWKLFNSFESLEKEQSEAKARRKAEVEAERRRQIEQAEAERRRQQEEVERQRQKEEERRRQEEGRKVQQRTALEREKSALQTELANLRGLFTGRRRREIEGRLAEIEQKLKTL